MGRALQQCKGSSHLFFRNVDGFQLWGVLFLHVASLVKVIMRVGLLSLTTDWNCWFKLIKVSALAFGSETSEIIQKLTDLSGVLSQNMCFFARTTNSVRMQHMAASTLSKSIKIETLKQTTPSEKPKDQDRESNSANIPKQTMNMVLGMVQNFPPSGSFPVFASFLFVKRVLLWLRLAFVSDWFGCRLETAIMSNVTQETIRVTCP